MPRQFNPDIHRRRSIRLPDYDYTQVGAYYVTIVTSRRRLLFGDVVADEMRLNDAGRLIEDAWQWLVHRYSYVSLDEYIVMPNHLHGIIVIGDQPLGASRSAPTPRKPLGQLIGAFKTVSTRRFNNIRGTPGQQLWQRNYYERIVRNEEELNHIREYILGNPVMWDTDEENPDAVLPA